MRPFVQPLSTLCSHLARLPVLNPGNGWKTSWCACPPILATSERYFRATGRKSQRLAASSMQLSESGSNLPELRKSCCRLHITPCHLYVLRRMLTSREILLKIVRAKKSQQPNRAAATKTKQQSVYSYVRVRDWKYSEFTVASIVRVIVPFSAIVVLVTVKVLST